MVMDDCHACIDAIPENIKIKLPREHPAYQPLLTLFGPDLKEQGAGTFAEIEQGDYKPFLPVPYWALVTHQDSVAGILQSKPRPMRSNLHGRWPKTFSYTAIA
jgi:hypothetical protein